MKKFKSYNGSIIQYNCYKHRKKLFHYFLSLEMEQISKATGFNLTDESEALASPEYEYYFEEYCGFTVQIERHFSFENAQVLIVLKSHLNDSDDHKIDVFPPNKIISTPTALKAYFLNSEKLKQASFFKIFLILPKTALTFLSSDPNSTVNFIPCKHFYKMSHNKKKPEKGIPGFETEFPMRCDFEVPSDCHWVALRSGGKTFERVQSADGVKRGMYVDDERPKWFAMTSSTLSSLFVSPLIERRFDVVEVSFFYVVAPGSSLSVFAVDENFKVEDLRDGSAYGQETNFNKTTKYNNWVFARVQVEVPSHFHSFHVSVVLFESFVYGKLKLLRYVKYKYIHIKNKIVFVLSYLFGRI